MLLLQALLGTHPCWRCMQLFGLNHSRSSNSASWNGCRLRGDIANNKLWHMSDRRLAAKQLPKTASEPSWTLFLNSKKRPGGIPNISPSNSKLSYSSPHPSLHLVIDNALSLSAHPFGSHSSHLCPSPSPLSQKSFAQENVSQERQLNPRFFRRSARSSHILRLLNSPSKSHLRPSLSVCHRISLAAHYKPQVFASFASAASNSLYTRVFIHIPSASFL